jgi:hypothetical protein
MVYYKRKESMRSRKEATTTSPNALYATEQCYDEPKSTMAMQPPKKQPRIETSKSKNQSSLNLLQRSLIRIDPLFVIRRHQIPKPTIPNRAESKILPLLSRNQVRSWIHRHGT